VVAVRNSTFSDVITDGENGFLAETEEQWLKKLSRLIEDSALRQKMGELAHQKALQDYTTQNSHSEEYYEYLRKILKKTRD